MGLICMSANTVPSLFTCHLRNTSSVRYLRPRLSADASQRFVNGDLAEEFRRLHKEEAYFMAPAFAAGRVLADAMLDRLISQAYFNPLIIPLFHALVASSDNIQGGNVSSSEGSAVSGGGGGGASTDKAGFLIHVQVPVKMIGRTFAELFDVILEEKGYIPIALYRAPYDEMDELGIDEMQAAGEELKHAPPRARAPTVFFEGNRSTPGRNISSISLGAMEAADRLKRNKTSKHLRISSSTSITASIRESLGQPATAARRQGNVKSFGEVVDSNPLPYVYTSPIPGAIVGRDDTVICLTNTVGNPVSGLRGASLGWPQNSQGSQTSPGSRLPSKFYVKRAVSAEEFHS